jgi:hypothetical protein
MRLCVLSAPTPAASCAQLRRCPCRIGALKALPKDTPQQPANGRVFEGTQNQMKITLGLDSPLGEYQLGLVGELNSVELLGPGLVPALSTAPVRYAESISLAHAQAATD